MKFLLAGNLAIVTGSEAGVISGVLPSSELWRININNLSVTTVSIYKNSSIHNSSICIVNYNIW